MKANISILLDRGHSFLHTVDQLSLTFQQHMQCLLVLPIVVQPQADMKAVFGIFFEVALGVRHCELIAVL